MATRAIDGNTATTYGQGSCTHTNNDDPPWWRVDLQADVAVKTVTVWNRGDCCGNRLDGFEVKVGDKAEWNLNSRCGGRHAISQGQSKAVECGGKQGRFVFVTMPRREHLTLCEVKVLAWQVLKWNPNKVASGTQVSADGLTWTQGSGHDWQGAMGDTPLCTDGRGEFQWSVTIVKGTYHQVGVALDTWDAKGTKHSNANQKFAFLYSHHSGWTRHRGAALPVGSPSGSTWWSGTWDKAQKGSVLTVSLNCAEHEFEVRTEQQWLGRMKYPSSWTTVYPAAGGQSSDHEYKIGDFLKKKEQQGLSYHLCCPTLMSTWLHLTDNLPACL